MQGVELFYATGGSIGLTSWELKVIGIQSYILHAGTLKLKMWTLPDTSMHKLELMLEHMQHGFKAATNCSIFVWNN